MPARDSKQSLSSTLVSYYTHAQAEVFGKRMYVKGDDNISKFRVLEDDLRDLNIPLREYAYTVTNVLHTWCTERKFNHVPINVFCGKWAFGKFLKVWKSETVDIVDAKQCSRDEMFYSELVVARRYIESSLYGDRQVRFREIVDELEPLLSKKWLQVYNNRENHLRPIDEVLEILCEEYGIRQASSYTGIVDKWTNTHSTVSSG